MIPTLQHAYVRRIYVAYGWMFIDEPHCITALFTTFEMFPIV